MIARGCSARRRAPGRFWVQIHLRPNRLLVSHSSEPACDPRDCGICLQNVKTGQGTAIFTAECSHAFHFPCIAAHVRKEGSLFCPVCNARWKEVPLLAIHKHLPDKGGEEKSTEGEKGEPAAIRDKKGALDTRAYDDDEPLVSPTGPRFHPIPEADEDDEEIEEFQGFFVNPSKPSRADAMNGQDLKRVDAGLMPEAAVVSVGRSHESYAVVLKVKAPPTAQDSNAASLLNPPRRAPVDLVTVLDVSGSMTGAKLQMLKRAMRLVIASLGSADRLSIVAFSGHAKRLMPLSRMSATGQRTARRIVDRLACGQGTCVGEALRKATKVLEDRRERNPVASIMLLSDGQDERAPQNATSRRRRPQHVQSTRFTHLEIPVHESGFGNRQPAHEPAEDAFTKCVGGLLSVVVQDVRIQLGFASGSAPAEISAVYSCSGRPAFVGAGSFRLGDLYAEEERELLVELRVPSSAAGAHHVMSVRCSYRDPATQDLVQCKEQALLVPRPHAVRSSAPKIERLRNLFITTKSIAEARRQADRNDLASATHLLSSARALLLQFTSISADENLLALEAELAELHQRRQQQQIQRRRIPDPTTDESSEPLTPTSAWRAAEQLAKVAIMRKSLNRVSDLHGFENARF
ncbi:E3 ubiquitin-protein ligase WAV3-like isoform X2 [Magnolia sinica]|uniref:E3 ubiquitin-protein ligase WAV3-like isoform X2 n=1 Tax=Magnolia sinica TaxID=86752 RepID=UPI00265920CB|nr:E3 ubiquitin-protein ligase WAV3-like isoform X2 [Magnolia sinica]